ncbi:glycosyltransferase family 25 protein [Sulfurovum sp.]|uniref:glycosyltransferase family 25 protein n=1 Tax=Sulfurovum sp. TaxID=1969726 RepID=UPI0025E1211B|nr:glycosyltransferase family 25 protein [Sulfurovum sp.]
MSYRIFIINLEKEKKKKEHMLQLCKKLNLKNVEIINAVNGQNMDDEFIDNIVSKEKTIKFMKRGFIKGEIGCLLSHKKIYEKMVKENIPNALILEDDVEFDNTLYKALKLSTNFPREAEFVFLGYWNADLKNINKMISFRGRHRLSSSLSLIRFTSNVHGNYGYFITKNGAKKLLKHLNKPLFMPIDHYTGDDKYINIYGVYPPVIHLSPKFSLNTEMEKGRQRERDTIQTKEIQNKNRNSLKMLLKMIGLLKPVQITKQEILSIIARSRKPKKYE